jgi:uncharacterized protein YecT (DUF1311 family)
MRKNLFTIIVLSLLLVLLSGCNQNVTNSKEGSFEKGITGIKLKQSDLKQARIGTLYDDTHVIDDEGRVWSIDSIDPSKVSQVTIDKKFNSISSGQWGSALLLAEDGTVYGASQEIAFKQLSDGTRVADFTPVPITGLKNIVYVSDALKSKFALDKNGDVYIWGDLATEPITTPRKEERLKNIISMSTFKNDAIFLDSNGNLKHMYLNRPGEKGPYIEDVKEKVPENLNYLFPGATEFFSGGMNHSVLFAMNTEGDLYHIQLEEEIAPSPVFESSKIHFSKIKELKEARLVIPTEKSVDDYHDHSGKINEIYYSSQVYFKILQKDGSIATLEISPNSQSFKIYSTAQMDTELVDLYYGNRTATAITLDGKVLVSDEYSVIFDSKTDSYINPQEQKDILPTKVLEMNGQISEEISIKVRKEIEDQKEEADSQTNVESNQETDHEQSTNQAEGTDITPGSPEAYLEKLDTLQTQERESSTGVTTDIKEDNNYNYQLWDEALNEIYGVLKNQLTESQMNELREKQREWITYRDQAAQESYDEEGGGSASDIVYGATLVQVTKERCYELVKQYIK